MSARRWAVALLLASLAGCARSPATQFFTLMPVRPERTRSVVHAGAVQVRAVHIPAALDRPERVVQSSPQRLMILEEQQWAAPLADMIRRVLSEDLAARLPPGRVLMPHVPSGRSTRGLVVDIQEFRPALAGHVTLDVAWTLLPGPGGRPEVHGAGRFELPSGSDADSQVSAMSGLLARLADAIVGTLAGAVPAR